MIAKLTKILVNEAEVTITTVVKKEGEAGTKKAVKSVSQEAMRAEIGRDARALIDLTPAHPALAARKVDLPSPTFA